MVGHATKLVRASLLVVGVLTWIATANVGHAAALPVFAPGYSISQAPTWVQPQWQRLIASVAPDTDMASLLWRELHDAARHQHPRRQLQAVNSYFNRIQYGEDSAIYGARDYWASPAELIASGFGDCEDYAVAKYAALRALGWRAEDLMIVVVRDLKNAVNHAVLAARLEDHWYVLDNRATRVLKPAEVAFYQPVYAVNEHGLFIFERRLLTERAGRRTEAHQSSDGDKG